MDSSTYTAERRMRARAAGPRGVSGNRNSDRSGDFIASVRGGREITGKIRADAALSDPVVPGAPTDISATAGNAQATVTFTPPVSDGGSPITSYTVTSTPGGVTATGSSSPITVSGLTNGTAYTFTVVATNTAGNSVPSVASNSVTPVTIPDAPTGVSASAGNAQATVTFTPPAMNGGSPITSYTVTSTPGGFSVSGSNSPLTVTGLSNGTAYTFTVIATNAIGDSSPSAASSAVTPVTAPAAPTGLAATVGNTQLTISFTPGNNGGSPITNYQYSLNNGSSYTAFSPATGDVSSVTITGLTNGTPYNIKLKTVTAVGASADSATVSGTPAAPATVPSSPTALSGVGGDQAIYVLFTAGENGGSAITNYEYSVDGGSTFTAFSPAQTFSPVEISGIGLTNGTAYDVQLKAVNAIGSSIASATVSVTPTATTLLTSDRLIRLDANDSSSYSGSGSAWTNTDSAGSYSATLVNTPTFNTDTPSNKFFTFDGINQISQIAAAAAINPTVGGAITVQIWARVNTASANFGGGDGLISKQFGPGSYDGYSLSLGTNGNVVLNMNGGAVNGNYGSSNNVFGSGWALYTIVVRFGGGSGNPSYAYVSTRRVVSANNAESSIPLTNAPLQFPRGIQDGSYNYCPADVGAFYYYNTALSQEDIIRNYDATKARYGL